MGYMDSTGRFAHCSASGHEYLLVENNCDANEILFEPLKNCQEKMVADRW